MAIWAGSTREFAINLATAPLFIAAIIAHELAHAQTAKAFGIPVRHIALTWFGGQVGSQLGQASYLASPQLPSPS